MAQYTEEISEKIADLLLSQTPRAADVALKTGGTVVKGVGAISSQTLDKFLKSADDAKKREKLLSMQGEVSPTQMNQITEDLGMKSRVTRVTHSDVADYEKILKEQNLLYAKLSASNDDYCSFVHLECDAEKFIQAAEVLKAQRGKTTEVAPKMYMDHLAPDTVETLDGLDDVEIALFRYYARRSGLLYTVLDRADNSHMIVYSTEDAVKARRAMLHTGWDLTGANGALYRKQVEYHLEGHNKIHFSAEDASAELYIVSRDRPDTFVHITEEDYTLYKSGKPVSTVSRDQGDFVRRCVADCLSVPSGVVLTADQYSPDISYEDIMDMPTISLHVSDYEEEVETARINGLIRLVEQKGGDGDMEVYGLETPEVTYENYADQEFILDSEEREARSYEFNHFKEAAYYSRKHLKRDTIHLDQRSVDYIIARAEERKGTASQGVPERGKSEPTMGGQGPTMNFL